MYIWRNAGGRGEQGVNDTLNGDIQILQLAEDCYKQFANKSKVLH